MIALVIISLISCSAAQRPIEEKLRLLEPILMLTDELLEHQGDDKCVEKLFCLLETEIARDIDNPLMHVSRFLTNTRNDTDPSDFRKIEALIQRYPHVSKMLDSIHLGQSSGESTVCSAAFSTCEADPYAMIEAARKYDDINVVEFTKNSLQRRKACTYIKAGCTGLKVGCGICAIFTYGTCGFACGGLVGAACTASSLTCTAIGVAHIVG
ncbi:uncharacterized protein LOC132742873 [Ruditapes philippinarum]|uniref:uncharacterized protein LOC132742873 n=1 Tax=Ruditapes philippinarum TaxID=129788 RepID=UPI00295AED51|nr:uncharacterized protein LOC132742873 [Ruditapes philippinarum]